ncbi:MAG: L,D-transpeptidase [Actinobacteria bacterium]|nr:L,D-transpeptidase [Actinomycetota bacterium]
MRRGLALLALVVACACAPAVSAAPYAQQSFLVVRPAHASLALHAAPGGPVLAKVGRTTSFGTPVVLGVVARRTGWFGVTTDAVPNGKVGWVRSRDAVVGVVHDAIRVSLSAKKLELYAGGRLVRSYVVGIGAASSPTPVGRFAVAEKLPGSSQGSVYGCCILGLSVHQLHPPASWSRGGNYLVAIHGGGGLGTAVSAGCLHLDEAGLRYLMDDVPLGTPVFIEG